MLSLPLAFLAGLLSILSPCVLPLLPIVLGAAASEHKRGPFLLAAGLSLSFVVIGLFVALVGWNIGLDAGFFRNVGALLIVAVGATLSIPALQTGIAVASGPISGWLNGHLSSSVGDGRWGQFGVGILLGAVWSPCVGPTLGAASVLAAKGESLGEVTLVMTAFGLGAALPLAVLGLLSREAMMRWRLRMLSAGSRLKMALGILLVFAGMLVLTNQDRHFEAALVNMTPTWLTELTTRF